MEKKIEKAEAVQELAHHEHRSVWRDAWVVLRRDKAALAGGVVIIVLVFTTILAPYLAPYDPVHQFYEGLTDKGAPLPPSQDFRLGTDQLGRDVWSRLLFGGRISLGIGVVSSFLAVGLGVALGAIAGYIRGIIDALIMRSIDIIMGFPVLLLSVGLIAVLEPGPLTIVLVIAFVNSTYLARIVYNMVLSIKEREFIIAAHSIGASHLRILNRHIFPQLVPIIVVYAALGVSSSVMMESTLSYVGIGIQPPTPSWGNMINEGQRYYRSAPWLVLYPGGLIALSVLAMNLLGDGLRDVADPYSRTKRR